METSQDLLWMADLLPGREDRIMAKGTSDVGIARNINSYWRQLMILHGVQEVPLWGK